MKKFLSMVLCVMLTIGSNALCFANDEITVKFNGIKIEFDVAPQIINNRIMVPMRKIFETMGADVEWNESTKTVTATKRNTKIMATIGSKDVYINGGTKTIDVAPQVVSNRTMVPTRFIAESFGAKVVWNEELKTAYIGVPWKDGDPLIKYPNHEGIDFGRFLGIPGSFMGECYRFNKHDVTTDDIKAYVDRLEYCGFNINHSVDCLYMCTKGNDSVSIYIAELYISVLVKKI